MTRVRGTPGAPASIRFRPCGARTFEQLVHTHGGNEGVALALVLGELHRLLAYSRNGTKATHGSDVVLPTEAARIDPTLASAIDRLAVRRATLLASGKALLADRANLFLSGALRAAPRVAVAAS